MPPYGFNYQGFQGGFQLAQPPTPPPPQATPPLSQHQLNSYKTLLDMSSPQERQQMLQQLQKAAGNNPAAAQLHQTFQGYNTGQQQQNVYGNSFTTNLTNYALNGGVAGSLYNNMVKPIGENAYNVGRDIYQAQFALPEAQREQQSISNELDSYQQQVQQQFNSGRINAAMYKNEMNKIQNQRQGINSDLQKATQQAPTTGQAVNDIGQFGVNLLAAGLGGENPEAAISPATSLAAARTGVTGADLAAQVGTARVLPSVLSGANVSGIGGAMLRGGLANAGFGAASSGIQAATQGANPGQIAGAVAGGAAQGYATGAILGAGGHIVEGGELKTNPEAPGVMSAVKNDAGNLAGQVVGGSARLGAKGLSDAAQQIAEHYRSLPFNNESGTAAMNEPLRPTTYDGAIKQAQQAVYDIKNTIAARRLQQQEMISRVNENPNLSAEERSQQIGAVNDQTNGDIRTMQQHQATVEQHLRALDPSGKSMPTISGPHSGVPLAEKTLLDKQMTENAQPRTVGEQIGLGIRKMLGKDNVPLRGNGVTIEQGSHAMRVKDLVKQGLSEREAVMAISNASKEGGSIDLGADLTGREPKPLGEQIGRLKAAIAKEPDPNTKAELSTQLKSLNQQFAAEKNAKMKGDFESVMGKGTTEARPKVDTSVSTPEKMMADSETTKAKEDAATAEAIKRQSQAPEPYKGLKEPKNWQDVRDNGYSAGKLSTDNTEAIARQADEIFGKKADKKRLFLVMDSIEHPEDLGANAAKLKISPETLQSFIAKFKTATDFTHSLRSGFGEAINYRNLYALHPWDLHNEDVKAALGELQKSQGGAFHGSAALERIWPTLRDGPSSFALKKLSVGDAIREWGKEERTAVQAAALKQSILKKDPHGFVDFSNEGQPRTPDGKPYKISSVPGLSGWLTPEAYHATQGFRILDMDSMGKGMQTLVKGLDALNRLGKGVELLGGAFHDLSTSLRYTAQEVASAISPRSPLRPFRAVIHTWDMNRAFWDDGYYNHLVSKLHSDGWLDLLAKTHLTGTQATDATLLGSLKTGSIEKLNPYSKALFERKIDLMKKLSAIEEAKSMGITDPKKATAKQIDQLRGASDAINNRYGGLNLQTLNRNPIVQLVFRQVGLAPDFWEGKFRTDAAAVNFFNPLNRSAEGRAKSSLALRQIIGTTVLIGAISELTRQAMGQGSKNLQQAYNNDVKAPSIPLPFTNKQGQKIIGNLPATDVSEITRAFMDPGHYLTARLSAGVSLGAELATGKDYYGNTLTDLNRNPNPSILSNLAGALKSRLTIPGNQAMSMNNPNSTTNWPVALTNMLGLRVARDPNDPQYQQVQQYFQAYQKASQGLTPNQLHDFNELFPAKKDSQGNYLPDSKFDPFSSSVKSSILLKSAAGDGVVLNRMEQMNQTLGQHDPMWDVNNTVGQGTINGQNYPALNVFLKYQQFKADDPGSIAAKEIVANNPWITDLEKARTDYFNTPQMQSAFAKANAANPNAQNPIQYPNIDPQTQQLMTVAESIKDPAQKSQFINANPSLQQAYQALGNYTSQRQAQVMAPQFAQAPTPSPAVQAALNAKQYNAPGVQQYLNQEAAFKIAGPYGDGIGGAGGGRNTSPQAIANVSQGLQPNGKPSPYAQYAARSSASAARRSVRNAMKNENKQMKYAIKHSNKNIQRVSFKPNSSLEKALAKTKRNNPIA